MKVGLVTVGAELLSGVVVNGNAAWLGRRLAEDGIEVAAAVTVDDDVEDIAAAVLDGLSRAEAVVVTGGLGPTSDDLTRQALARAAGVDLRRDPGLEAQVRGWYAERGRDAPDQALQQADVPVGAVTVPNPQGSAPGLRVLLGDGVVYAVPGVPAEMVTMVERSVVPELVARRPPDEQVSVRTVRTVGAGETDVARALRPLEDDVDRSGQARVAYLASDGEVRVRMSSRGEAPAREVLLDALVERAESLLGDLVYGVGDDTLDVVVHRLLAASEATVATAESVTGGLVGARLTDMPGSSGTFRGGVVAYATDLKAGLLDVDAALLDRHGPVHPEVAVQMAEGVRRLLGATYGVATTGVAGPEPQGAPVGTVHVAVAGPGGTLVRTSAGPGGRDVVRRRTVTWALALLREALVGTGGHGPP